MGLRKLAGIWLRVEAEWMDNFIWNIHVFRNGKDAFRYFRYEDVRKIGVGN